MKKSIKCITALLSAVCLITACSDAETYKFENPVIETLSESEIPSGPRLVRSEISEDFETLKTKYENKTIIGADGVNVAVSDAEDLVDLSKDSSYSLGVAYDFAYFTYTPSLYKGDMEFDISVESDEFKWQFDDYILSKAHVYQIKRGDKLQNGLICTDARTDYFVTDNKSDYFVGTEAFFSGELTLSGTLWYIKDDPLTKLVLIIDSDNGMIPCVYHEGFFLRKEYRTPTLRLETDSESPENIASLINGNEYTNVEVTIKDLHLEHNNNKTDLGSSATIVDMKVK